MNTKREKNKRLIQNIALFFLASFVPKTISFFMVPLYTGCLTTEQYGTIDLLTTTVQLLLPILTLQVQDAMLYFAVNQKEKPAEVFSIGLWIVFCGYAIVLLGMGAGLGLGVVRLAWPYVLFFLVHYFVGALHNVFTYFARAIDAVKHITVSSILCSVITVGCNLLFLLAFRWGVNGYLLANVLGHLVSLTYLFILARFDRYLTVQTVNKTLFKKIVRFSIPMIFSALAWWVNNSLDKYILSFFCGVSATGLLAVAYKVPTIIRTLGAVVSKAFSVSVLQHFDANDTDGFLGSSYATVSFSVVLCTSGLMLLNIPLAKILFSGDFFAAWQLVPPLLVAAAMNNMSYACENICIAMAKTKLISNTAIFGAIINTMMNLCLIPRIGAYGAALATAIGFFAVWLVRYIWVKRAIKLRNCDKKEPVSYALLWVQMILTYWGNRFLAIQIVICVALLLLYYREIVRIGGKYLGRMKVHFRGKEG